VTMQVFLVPGLLGFDRLGSLVYFDPRIDSLLRDHLASRGREVTIHALSAVSHLDEPGRQGTIPTPVDVPPVPARGAGSSWIVRVSPAPAGAIEHRARALLRAVLDAAKPKGRDELCFVTHSTGGLDARLLLSEGAVIDGRAVPTWIRNRTRSVITISAPHHGAPLANLALSLNLPTLVAAMAFVVTGQEPWRLVRQAGALAARLAAWVGRIGLPTGEAGWLAGVLGDLGIGPGDSVYDYLRSVARDNGAFFNLAPETCVTINSALRPPGDVHFAEVVSMASPSGEANLLFQFLWKHSRAPSGEYPYPAVPLGVARAVEGATGMRLGTGDDEQSDGVVACRSQMNGRVGCVAVGDHLDVVGMYRRKDGDAGGPSSWLVSGSNFGTPEFERLWRWIADELVDCATTADPNSRPIVIASARQHP